MKKDDAKQEIFKVLREYSKEHDVNETASGFKFYTWLQDNRDDLLSFRCAGSKYQQIVIWVKEYRSLHP